jgi:predicted ester cyclase
MRINRRQALAGLATVPCVAFAAPFLTESGNDQEHDEIENTDLAARNAAIIRHHLAVMNSGDYSGATQFFAENIDNFGRPVGHKVAVAIFTDVYTTFPDWRMEIEELAALGADVIVRVTVTGTHKGVGKLPVNGGLLIDVPPTGKSFKVEHIHWYTLKNGLIVAHFAARDDIAMMQQLGLLPPAKPFTPPG